MLSKFRIQNFKSILDMEVDFSFAEGKAPNGYKESVHIPFIAYGNHLRHIPCLALFGANASGKTNILNALNIFKKMVISDISGNFFPNKLHDKYSTTLFELTFFSNGSKYLYLIEYDKLSIKKEILSKNEGLVFSIIDEHIDFSPIKTEEYSEKRLKDMLEVECSKIDNKKKYQHVTFLSKLIKNYPGLNQDAFVVFEYIKNKMQIFSNNDIPVSLGIEMLAEGKDEKLAFEKISAMLKKLDIDILKMHFSRTSRSTVLSHDKYGEAFDDVITTIHKHINGDEVEFELSEESSGTQQLCGLLGVILYALKNGNTVIMDELDRSLHPLLAKEIVRMFKSRLYNVHNAQLIFSTHNTDILDDDILRVSDVAIINKTRQDGTTIKRLSDFEGIRNVNNFRKQYLSGNFSGIPFPYI